MSGGAKKFRSSVSGEISGLTIQAEDTDRVYTYEYFLYIYVGGWLGGWMSVQSGRRRLIVYLSLEDKGGEEAR